MQKVGLYKMGSILAISCLAAFSEIIHGYLLKTPRHTIALFGERIELDCITNSSVPIDWHSISNRSDGSTKVVWISRDNQTGKNFSDAFRIRHEIFGQFSLVIDHVLMSLAGRYTCNDKDGDGPVSAEVTVLNGTPSCAVSPSRKVVCTFGYTGNLEPELEWMPLRNSSWNASCNALNGYVGCVFERFCKVHNQSVKANTFVTICLGESPTCEWVTGNASSSVGLLRIKGYNKTVGSWRCASRPTTVTVAPTTSSSLTEEPRKISINLLLICVGVTSTAIILLLLVFRTKYGICRKKGAAHGVMYDRGTGEQENFPVYAQVQKKRKAQPKNAVIGHDTWVFDNSLYASSKTSGVAKTASEVSRNKVATDDIIYAELRQVPRETRISGQRAPIREGFDTSTYAFIDHNLRAPALLPK